MEKIRCRVVACRESRRDGKQWSFYLINDNALPIESAELETVEYEWGDHGPGKTPQTPITELAPNGHVLLWRDDSDAAELRMDIYFRVRMAGVETSLVAEFPKLYRMKNLPLVDGLGKPGFEVIVEGPD